MKKLLLLPASIICGIFCAQQTKIDIYREYLKNDLVKKMENGFHYKNYSKPVLNILADSIILNNPAPCKIEGFETEYDNFDDSKFLKNLDLLTKTNSDREAIDKNLCILFGETPYLSEFESEDGILENGFGEVIPNDIFLVRFNSGGNFTDDRYYKIEKDKLQVIGIEPSDKFFKIVNKKIKSKSFFDRLRWTTGTLHGGIVEKIDADYYLISSPLYNDDYSDGYLIEYKTKDFKKFVPIRIRHDEDSKWINFN